MRLTVCPGQKEKSNEQREEISATGALFIAKHPGGHHFLSAATGTIRKAAPFDSAGTAARSRNRSSSDLFRSANFFPFCHSVSSAFFSFSASGQLDACT